MDDAELQQGIDAALDQLPLSGLDVRVDIEGWTATAQVFLGSDQSFPNISVAHEESVVTVAAPSPPPPSPSPPDPPRPPSAPLTPSPPPETLDGLVLQALAGANGAALQECLRLAEVEDVEVCRACPTNARATRNTEMSHENSCCECESDFYATRGNCTDLVCEPCPTGTNCTMPGSRIDTLSVLPGYFRASIRLADVRPCPDVPASQRDDDTISDESGCGGGNGAGAAVCREGLDGIYCMQCTEVLQDATSPGYYYSASGHACLPCGGVHPLYAVTLAGVVPLLLVLLARFAHGRMQRSAHRMLLWGRQLRSSTVVASLVVTAKTLIGFYQIVSRIEEVFIMRLPLKAVVLIEWFSWLELDLGQLVPLECLGYSGYVNRLRMHALLPVVLSLAAIFGGLLFQTVSSDRGRGINCLRGACMTALPWALISTFMVFPHVVSLAFQAFRCECFEDTNESWLRADYSLKCSFDGCPFQTNSEGDGYVTDEYREARQTASVILVLFGAGLPIVYAVLLRAVAKTLATHQQTPLSNSLHFLHGGFRPGCYWWEVANLVRKLTTVGVATLILPGTLMQLVVVLMIVVAFQLLLVVMKPYRASHAGLLAEVEQLSLLVLFLLCVLIKIKQVAVQLDKHMSDELRKRFFFDSEAVANLLITAILASVGVTLAFVLRYVGVVARGVWQRVMLHHVSDDVDEREVVGKQTRFEIEERARAIARFDAVLKAPASGLETPALSYSPEAVVNPVMCARVEEAKAEARTQAPGRPSRKNRVATAGTSNLCIRVTRVAGSPNVSAKPASRGAGALRRLNLQFEDATASQSAEGRARALQRYLQRSEGVTALRQATATPEAAVRARVLARHVNESSLAAAPGVSCGAEFAEQRETCRARLMGMGWTRDQELATAGWVAKEDPNSSLSKNSGRAGHSREATSLEQRADRFSVRRQSSEQKLRESVGEFMESYEEKTKSRRRIRRRDSLKAADDATDLHGQKGAPTRLRRNIKAQKQSASPDAQSASPIASPRKSDRRSVRPQAQPASPDSLPMTFDACLPPEMPSQCLPSPSEYARVTQAHYAGARESLAVGRTRVTQPRYAGTRETLGVGGTTVRV